MDKCIDSAVEVGDEGCVCVSERQRESDTHSSRSVSLRRERWGAGVETQKIVREEIGGWGRVPFNKLYAPLLSTIYDEA